MRQSPPRWLYFYKKHKRQTDSEFTWPQDHTCRGVKASCIIGPTLIITASNSQGWTTRLGVGSTWRDPAGRWSFSWFSWWLDLLFVGPWCQQRKPYSPSILSISSGTMSVNGQKGRLWNPRGKTSGIFQCSSVKFYSLPTSPRLTEDHLLVFGKKLFFLYSVE